MKVIRLLVLFFSITTSCSEKLDGEAGEILIKMRNVSLNGRSYHMLISDSIEILTGHISPQIIKQYTNENFSHISEKDIFFIVFNSTQNVQKVSFKDVGADEIHILKNNYKKGDTIYFSRVLDDKVVHLLIGKNSDWGTKK